MGFFDSLPTLGDRNGKPVPKGKTRKQLKAKKDRDDAKRLKQFRDDVWAREEEKAFQGEVLFDKGYNVAACQHCDETVVRGPDIDMTGEVHHRTSRRYKATRYDPDNGVLLCNHRVNNCHRKAQRKEIEV